MMTKPIILLFVGCSPYCCRRRFLYEVSARSSLRSGIDNDARLEFPDNYRSGCTFDRFRYELQFDTMQMDHHMFDSVFVNPRPTRRSRKPDMAGGDVLGARSPAKRRKRLESISEEIIRAELMGVEVHVKDRRVSKERWAFSASERAETAKMVPTTAECCTSATPSTRR